MKRILIVKVTALGDIIQAQPIVADLHRAFPGVEIDWAADELFADVARWNPGIRHVHSAPLKQFKKTRSMAALGDIASSIGALRRDRYDVICDIQGVYKSAIISWIARGKRRFGYLNQDLGERGAAFAYSRRFEPRPPGTTVQSMRTTVARALGYTVEETPSFGLRIPGAEAIELHDDRPMAILFHGTSKDDKKWPHAQWVVCAQQLVSRGMNVVLPWGSDKEQQAAQAVVAEVPGATMLPRLSVLEMAQYTARAALVVGTDTGFTHLAYALERPTVLVLTATTQDTIGISYPGRAVTVGDAGKSPSTQAVLDAIESVWPAPAAEQQGLRAEPSSPARPAHYAHG
ncbi:MAG TPA: lipopolysaccharide heptosyltransferase I [Pararobbsia sp.]|nr:lipopolysaccharide heptosyltransferase I [Pararobbsia sp.]